MFLLKSCLEVGPYLFSESFNLLEFTSTTIHTTLQNQEEISTDKLIGYNGRFAASAYLTATSNLWNRVSIG